MSLDGIRRLQKRYRRGTEHVINELASGGFDSSTWNFLAAAERQLRKEWSRIQSRVVNPDADSDKKTACARAWLDTEVNKGDIRSEIESLLVVVRDGGRLGASASVTTRRLESKSAEIAMFAGFAATDLLVLTCNMVVAVIEYSSSAADKEAGYRAAALVAQGRLMQAAADALRAARGDEAVGLAAAAAQLVALLADMLLHRADAAGLAGSGGGGNSSSSSSSSSNSNNSSSGRSERSPCGPFAAPPGVSRAVEAVVRSELLAAAAHVIVDTSKQQSTTTLSADGRRKALADVHSASRSMAAALGDLSALRHRLLCYGGPEGVRLSGVLLCGMRHVAVRRLQVALLDQLAAHAGMGAGLGQEEGTEEGGGGRESGGGWAGLSGAWWLAREEAERGQVLGAEGWCNIGWRMEQLRGRAAPGRLRGYHSSIVSATLGEWASAGQDRAAAVEAAAGAVQAEPPPLLAARLAARAAESLWRLCHGQGLGGAYAPGPDRDGAQLAVVKLLPPKDPTALPVATARACLPHWLEAGGWALALASEAAAAAAAGSPPAAAPVAVAGATPRAADIQEGDAGGWRAEARVLQEVIVALDDIAFDATYTEGPRTLSAAAQADVRLRLHRCRLAASLDRTLRLAYSALEGSTGAAADGTPDLQGALALGWQLTKLALLLPPAAAPGGGGDGGGGGAEAGDQLGLLLTLCKRAAALTQQLEGWERGDGPTECQGLVLVVVRCAQEVLEGLVVVVDGMKEELGRRLEAACKPGPGPRPEGDGDTAGWCDAAGCVDEAHEALALAARAACGLAAALAWRLAVDTRRAEPDTAMSEGPSSELMGDQMPTVVAVMSVLHYAVRWCQPPLLLPSAHLLACQPHRLVAAACALAAVLPGEPAKVKKLLCSSIATLVVSLSRHGALSSRVHSWLALPPPPLTPPSATPRGAVSSSTRADPCAGCLAAHVASWALCHAPVSLARRQIAAQEQGPAGQDAPGIKGCCYPVRKGSSEGLRQGAAGMAALVLDSDTDPSASSTDTLVLPDGTRPAELLRQEADANANLLPPPSESLAPDGVMPPPLVLPPSRAGALPRLRVCGNPRCCNFGGESEGALPLKQCGGCRAVRYCGADCQRAHWREGHRAECAALAAGVE